MLSSLYVYLHAAITIKDAKLHALIESRSTRPALLGAVLITLGGVLWYVFLPASAQAAMYAAPVLNVFMGVLFAATGVVFVLLVPRALTATRAGSARPASPPRSCCSASPA